MSAAGSNHQVVAAEQAVLGAILSDNALLWRVGTLEPEDFSDAAHREIYASAVHFIRQGQPVDAGGVYERLAERQVEVEGSDLGYIAGLVRNLASTRNVHRYAEVIRRHSRCRRARLLLSEGMERLEEEPGGGERITELIRGLQRIVAAGGESIPFAKVLEAAEHERAERERLKREGRALGISSTLPRLDGALGGGIHGPTLNVLGGRPGRFKSVLAWQIAVEAARDGHPVGVVSLEMSAAELGERALRRTTPNPEWPVWLDHRSRSLPEIAGRIVEWRHVHGIELAVLDHIQLVKADQRNRFEELSEVSRTLKELAMELEIPVLALSQLSREVERERRAPRLSDLRECGNLEQDADVVVFLHAERANGAGPGGDDYQLLVAKNRGGAARFAPIPLFVDGARALVGERV